MLYNNERETYWYVSRSKIMVSTLYWVFLYVVTPLLSHHHLPLLAVALAHCLSLTPVESFGQVLPDRTSSLSVHLLSSIACLQSPLEAECLWQEPRSFPCTAR